MSGPTDLVLSDRAALALIDDAERALASVQDAEDADMLWRKVRAVEEAARLARLADATVAAFARVRLRAKRRWGELLGAPEPQARDEKGRVTGGHTGAAERKQIERARKLAAIPAEVFEAALSEPDPERPPTEAAILHLAGEKSTHLSNRSGENEWYTPAAFIEAAVATMGAIDLDPASSAIANETVGAERFHSVADDGLSRSQEWAGRVWLNPPYSRPLVDQFSAALAGAFADGRVDQACVLVNNATETNWFQTLAATSSAVFFPARRVKFWRPPEQSQGRPWPLQGQAVLYLGERGEAFRREFRERVDGWSARLDPQLTVDDVIADVESEAA